MHCWKQVLSEARKHAAVFSIAFAFANPTQRRNFVLVPHQPFSPTHLINTCRPDKDNRYRVAEKGSTNHGVLTGVADSRTPTLVMFLSLDT